MRFLRKTKTIYRSQFSPLQSAIANLKSQVPKPIASQMMWATA